MNPKKRKQRHKNSDHFSADTPISVRHHYRAGGPGYMTRRERIIRAGQRDLFAPDASMDDLLKTLRRNPTVLSAVKQKLGAKFKTASNSELKKAMRAVIRAAKAKTAAKKKTSKTRNPVTGRISKKQLGHAWGVIQAYDKQHGIRPLRKRNKTTINIRAKHVDLVRGRHNPSLRPEIKKLEREYAKLQDRHLALTARLFDLRPQTEAERAAYRRLDADRKALEAEMKSINQAIGRLLRDDEYQKSKRNPAQATKAKALVRKFLGRGNRGTRQAKAPDGTPKDLAKLGKLVSITAGGKKFIFEKQGRNPASPDLAADSSGKRLFIVNQKDRYTYPGNAGPITEIEYRAAKPHLSGSRSVLWYHKVGEENGKRPDLIFDAEGLAHIRGGDIYIESDGIHN